MSPFHSCKVSIRSAIFHNMQNTWMVRLLWKGRTLKVSYGRKLNTTLSEQIFSFLYVTIGFRGNWYLLDESYPINFLSLICVNTLFLISILHILSANNESV